MRYTQSQWILFFFIYCFLGWLWESCYVSVRKKEWVNRGFLHGPFLPIYGFGAIMVLWITLPVRDNVCLIFLLGLVGADVLEYLTGAAMEKLFRVRYWDYSGHRFNINGYICLSSAAAWGIFSVFLVKIIHSPIEKLIIAIPYYAADFLSVAGVAVFAADVTKSVQSALDLKEILERVGENSERVAALEAKLSGAAASLSKASEEVKNNIKSINERANAAVHEIQRQMEASVTENEKLRLAKLLAELEEFKKKMAKIQMDIISWRGREYRNAAGIIRRNPSVVSRKFKDALEEVKELIETKKKNSANRE